MRKIEDYILQQRQDGIGFRLLFDDHTWADTSYVIPGMKATYDCEGFSYEEASIACALSEIGKEDFTEERLIKILRKTFGLSGYARNEEDE